MFGSRQYRALGITIGSNLPLPGLLETQGHAEWQFHGQAAAVENGPDVWTDRHLPSGEVFLRHARDDRGEWFRFPRLADFLVNESDGSITGWPRSEESPETTSRLFVERLVPVLLARGGQLLLHASAVATSWGAIAFAGRAGRGKSSLAGYLACNGLPLLSDDCLVVTNAGEVTRSSSWIKLWSDSRAAITGATDLSELKQRVEVDCGSELLPLRRIFVLGEAAPTISITPLAPSEALLQLVRGSYHIEKPSPDQLRAEFDGFSRLAESNRCFALSYPRHFEGLAAVKTAILSHLAGSQPSDRRLH